MLDQTLVGNSHGSRPDPGREAGSEEERRRYNREFMRRWRADPFHLAEEQAQRRQRYYASKQRHIQHPAAAEKASGGAKRMCGFCWKRPAVRKIMRLQVCESAPDGYAKVAIPYCGKC
jgi:hypothetical protein